MHPTGYGFQTLRYPPKACLEFPARFRTYHHFAIFLCHCFQFIGVIAVSNFLRFSLRKAEVQLPTGYPSQGYWQSLWDCLQAFHRPGFLGECLRFKVSRFVNIACTKALIGRFCRGDCLKPFHSCCNDIFSLLRFLSKESSQLASISDRMPCFSQNLECSIINHLFESVPIVGDPLLCFDVSLLGPLHHTREFFVVGFSNLETWYPSHYFSYSLAIPASFSPCQIHPVERNYC